MASSLPDGRAAVARVDPEAFAEELEGLGETARWNALFAAVGPHLQALLSLLGGGLDGPRAEATLAGLLRDSRDTALPIGQLLAGSAVDLVRGHFHSEGLRSLAAPWPLHVGAGPEAPARALWAAFAPAAPGAGVPTPVGGSGRLTDALVGLVTERGGDVLCNIDVDEILVREGRATGVRTTAGFTVDAREAVVVSTTSDQRYGRLLRSTPAIPSGVRAQALGYRYRRGCFQMNLALSAPPSFRDTRLDDGGALNNRPRRRRACDLGAPGGGRAAARAPFDRVARTDRRRPHTGA